MPQVGRISGPLLKDNLLREGVDLAFETDLLYLKVAPQIQGYPPNFDEGDPNWPGTNTGNGIGINTDSFSRDLEISGKTLTTDALVSGTAAQISNIFLNSSGSITSLYGPINVAPAGLNATITHSRVLFDDIEINDNYIKTLVTNVNLELRPHGTGDVDISASKTVYGDVNVSGNILLSGNLITDGQVIVGDSPLDTVTIVPEFDQTLEPAVDNTYDFGSPTNRWKSLVFADNTNPGLEVENLTLGGQTLFENNSITTLASNDPITLDADSGNILIDRIQFNANTITNLENTPLTITSTNNGYLQFSGTNGFVIPSGDNSQRPGSPVEGLTRWNTQEGYLEVFDGTVWSVATGGGAVITSDNMEDLSNLYAIILG